MHSMHGGLQQLVSCADTAARTPEEVSRGVVAWWHVQPALGRTATLLASLPPDVLKIICSCLDDAQDLLAMRCVCRAWRTIPAQAVRSVDIPMRWFSHDLPAITKTLSKVFVNVSTVTLSALASTLNHHPPATPTNHHQLPVTFTWIINHLTAMRALRHLRLHDYPLLPPGVGSGGSDMAVTTAGSGSRSGHRGGSPASARDWQLDCLRNLRRVTSLEIRMLNLMTGAGPEAVQSAQDSLLSHLPALTHLTHLAIRLVDLARVRPASTDPAGNHQPPVHLHQADMHQGPLILDADELDLVDLDHGEPHPLSHDAPSVRPFTELGAAGSRLRWLELTHVALRHGAVTTLLGALPELTHLSLDGRAGWSHGSVSCLARMSGLRDLGLSGVQLIFSEEDAEDCPETLMTHMYEVLSSLPAFESLRFQVADMDRTRFMHTAYLLGLWECDQLISQLRSLTLATVIWDSDYSVGILASLTQLTSLKVHYETWPLSLHCDDLSQLTSLTNLRKLQLLCTEDEDNYLIALSSNVLKQWSTCLTRLTCLHWSGPILLDSPRVPELAGWLSLTDLSLSYTPDPSLTAFTPQYATPHPRTTTSSGGGGGGGGSDGPDSTAPDHRPGQQTRAQPRKPVQAPWWRLDEDGGLSVDGGCGGYAKQQLGLDLTTSLPPLLKKLSLSNVAVSVAGMRYLGTQLPQLSSLQLSDCGVTPLHLLALTDNHQPPPPLEVLILHDLPSSPPVPPQQLRTRSDTFGGCVGVSGQPAEVVGQQEAEPVGCGEPNRSWLMSHQPPWQLWCDPARGHTRECPRFGGDPCPRFPCPEHQHGDQPPQQQQGSTVGDSLRSTDTSATDLEHNYDLGTPPGWWKRRSEARYRLAVRSLCERLGGCLNYLMLVVPVVVDLPVAEVVEPLAGLQRLKALTLQAPGCEWNEEDVREALAEGPRGLRALHVRWCGGQQMTTSLAAGTDEWPRKHPYLEV